MKVRKIIFLSLVILSFTMFSSISFYAGQNDKGVEKLSQEVGKKGWIAFSARSDNGTWDLFLMRPDGSELRNITNTDEYEEAAPRFSPDSKSMLYRRMKRGAVIDHDKWGFQGQLVIANADGSSPNVIGKDREFPWASWTPNGKEIVCLSIQGIQYIDLETKQVLRQLPRKGIYQQLFPSPDGKWFCGTANAAAIMWTVVRMDVKSGELNVVKSVNNCTPDWFPDSKHIIFSSRPKNQTTNNGIGWTQLWMADGDGTNQQLLYGEDGYHIYGGALSPDGKYIVLTKCPVDGGGSEREGAPICIMRFSDAPTIVGECKELRALHPNTKDGPILELEFGWEPCWTYSEITQ